MNSELQQNENINPSILMQQAQQPQQKYAPTPPLLNALEWLLNNPSIPLSLRKQFFVLWEIVPFGNYDEMDIKRLLLKFREYCIFMTWYMPDHKWGKTLDFKADTESEENIQTDLNMLFNMLYELYYVQLTRGKQGFTVKEMTTLRSINRFGAEEEQDKKKGVRLF